MIKNIDIHNVLQNYQQRSAKFQEDKLLLEAYNVLNGLTNKPIVDEDYYYDSNKDNLTELTIIKTLDAKCIFTITDIKKVSVDYHLRFLDNKNYSPEIPYNVHVKCSAFELRIGKPVKFKILTEPNNFKAKYPNTQHLIFADLGNNEFYFIMKWGNPFSNIRKIASYPFKRFETAMISVFLFALLITIITPSSFIMTHNRVDDYFSMARAAYYFYCAIFLSAIFTYYIVALRKNLNVTEWDSNLFL